MRRCPISVEITETGIASGVVYAAGLRVSRPLLVCVRAAAGGGWDDPAVAEGWKCSGGGYTAGENAAVAAQSLTDVVRFLSTLPRHPYNAGLGIFRHDHP